MNSFHQGCFAGQQRGFEGFKMAHAPFMTRFAGVEISHERARIQNHRFHLPRSFRYFLLVERSVTPLRKLPQTSAIKSWQDGASLSLRDFSSASRVMADLLLPSRFDCFSSHAYRLESIFNEIVFTRQ